MEEACGKPSARLRVDPSRCFEMIFRRSRTGCPTLQRLRRLLEPRRCPVRCHAGCSEAQHLEATRLACLLPAGPPETQAAGEISIATCRAGRVVSMLESGSETFV